MKYGLIGEHLKHSFSKEIHNRLGDYQYELKEIPRECFSEFMEKRDFLAINVTIPYKEQVIPYLHYIDDSAKEIGAVNTIVNRDGQLFGYNTDFYGMKMLILSAKIDLSKKKVAILGTGGTSKTAKAVAKSLSARDIITVSRTPKNGVITYEELYKNHKDTEIFINTTPLGMHPDIFKKPIDISQFPNISGVIDAIYNPLRTPLIKDGKNRNIPSSGGLYMLVCQGVRASEIFMDRVYEEDTLNKIYEELRSQKENIVLIGMPSSGKSTIGKALSSALGRPFFDTDIESEKSVGNSIPDIIKEKGEEFFRKIETETVFELSKNTGAIIATGGGVPLKKENIDALSQNGRIYFLDRPLSMLIPTDDRPLTSTPEALEKKYKERYDIYKSSADVIIDASGDIEDVKNKIIGEFLR